MSKKLSWFLLVSFFIFDNLFSYFAVTRFEAREANWAIASLVEKYPLLYFLCIPGTILILIIIIIKFLVWSISKLAVFKKFSYEEVKKALLGAMVFYWFIANTSLNILYIFGFRGQGKVWYVSTVVGIVLGIVYFLKDIPFRRAPSTKLHSR